MNNTVDMVLTGTLGRQISRIERAFHSGMTIEQRREKNSEAAKGFVPAPSLKLCIPSMKGFQLVEIDTIVYCEAKSNYTIFYFTNHTPICASKTISEYEHLLADCNFIRVHRSYVVNLGHISEYIRGEGGMIRLSNNHEIVVSRQKKDLLIQKIKSSYKF